MASSFPVDNNRPSINDGLWKTTSDTETFIKNFLNLSVTSIFAVDLKCQKIVDNIKRLNINAGTDAISNFTPYLQDISLLAYEAVLPGSSFETTQVFGDSQGITETFANKRVYPPVDVSFYIKNTYEVLAFFEIWLALISPINLNNNNSPNSYFKFNYPEDYKCDINIVKFEKELRPEKERLSKSAKGGGIIDPRTYTYTLINAYPTNLISVPVSYEQSSILRTTITFNYDRYWKQQHKERFNK